MDLNPALLAELCSSVWTPLALSTLFVIRPQGRWGAVFCDYLWFAPFLMSWLLFPRCTCICRSLCACPSYAGRKLHVGLQDGMEHCDDCDVSCGW